MSNSENRSLAIPTSAVPALDDDWDERTIAEIYQVSDIATLVDAKHKLAALKRYVQRKEDKNKVARTEIENRAHIGDLLGPNPGSGRQPGDVELSHDNSGLNKLERHEFRLLSAERNHYRRLLRDGELRYREIIKSIQRKRREKDEPADPDTDLPPTVHLELAPVADLMLASDLEPGSVDAIITDPPYGIDALGAWEDLGAFAKIVLRPGGIIVAYSGQMFLPEAMWSLSSLDYIWLGAVVHDGAFFQLRNHKIQVGWKPLLIYGQPPVKIEKWWNDTITDGRREKDYHGWQQAIGEAAALIEAFTSPGDLVVDPFLGGGTTAAAALRLGRHFIGGDTDPDAIEKTRERLAAE